MVSLAVDGGACELSAATAAAAKTEAMKAHGAHAAMLVRPSPPMDWETKELVLCPKDRVLRGVCWRGREVQPQDGAHALGYGHIPVVPQEILRRAHCVSPEGGHLGCAAVQQ